ncbi:MAG TPA: bifunctional phosphoglucose/phosphomannose isomerase [candidate division Zixibacteria bacterium]|nr:bifunctional phosphoglucose/phosphomannose isomerase [candidate division Zixibacteria bacterium]
MLNDLERIKKIDPGGMLDLLKSFPEQFRVGRDLALEADISVIEGKNFDNIVLCGMGGSAIGGDLVRAYAIDKLKVPFIINRDYQLPAFVGENSLVIGSSYSGNTEETLASFDEALDKGASAMAFSTGGKIIEIAQEIGIPHVVLPPGLPPRAALGYSFAPLLTIFERLGLIDDQSADIDETIAILEEGVEELSPKEEWKNNDAKSAATILHGTMPIIYSDDWHFNAVAVRFRGQINENAKQLAYSAFLPENNHNELVGWKLLGSLSSLIVGVFLDDKDINDRVKFRMQFLRSTIEELGVQTLTFTSTGESLLARMFSLIQLGDWTSYYMAILNEIDPKPVEIIDNLKAALGALDR